MVKATLAATLIAGSLVAVSAPASAEAASCRAIYQITSTWPGTPSNDMNMLGQVTVQNTGRTPIKGWRVSWRYTDGTIISQVWGAVRLPTVTIVGAYAFGNDRYNGELAVGGSTVFGFAAQGPASGKAPDPITCTPL